LLVFPKHSFIASPGLTAEVAVVVQAVSLAEHVLFLHFGVADPLSQSLLLKHGTHTNEVVSHLGVPPEQSASNVH
jgi:hypothetical protein